MHLFNDINPNKEYIQLNNLKLNSVDVIFFTVFTRSALIITLSSISTIQTRFSSAVSQGNPCFDISIRSEIESL